MRLDPPVPLSCEEYVLNVHNIEPLLQGYPMDKAPWPAATIKLRTGKTMYIRGAKLEEAKTLMG